MSIDLSFQLSYLLSDQLGESVEVTEVEYSSDGVLCVKLSNGGRGCVEVKACKGIKNPGKQAKCIIKTLSSNEKLLRQLVEAIKTSTTSSQ